MSFLDIFERVDKNKDGKISRDEFAEANRAFSPPITSEEVNEIFMELDVDGDGQIDLMEFASCLVVEADGEKNVDEVIIEKSFELYDTDGDGKISATDIHVLLNRLGEKRTMDECAAMVRASDVDGDGLLSFEEFKTFKISNNRKVL